MRISPNNPVRRCLFPADNSDESRTDNFANAFKESINEELIDKSKKYNYDFKNDRPLEGPIMWFEGDGRYDLIGVRRLEDSEEVPSPQADGVTESESSEIDKIEDSTFHVQNENETTPKTKDNDSVPALRKRKNDEGGSVSRQNVTVVKRRLYN